MKTPRTPIDFEYDLWTTEEGKCMVRIKETGQECEVSRELLKYLRAEEKQLRRSLPKSDSSESANGKDDERSILSLDCISEENDGKMLPDWLKDNSDIEGEVIAKLLEQELQDSLTRAQLELYRDCIKNGISIREYSKLSGKAYSSIRDAVELIRKKYKKIF